MSDSTVQIPPASTGQLVATRQITVASNSVQLQCVVLGDPTTADNYAAVTAKGTQGAFAQAVQELKDAGRAPITLQFGALSTAGGTALATTAALLSSTLWNAGSSSSGTSFAVPSGKTFRITSMSVDMVNTTTTANAITVWLVYSSSTLATTSAVIASRTVASVAAIAHAGAQASVSFDDGYEIPASSNWGIAGIASTTSHVAMVAVTGFYY